MKQPLKILSANLNKKCFHVTYEFTNTLEFDIYIYNKINDLFKLGPKSDDLSNEICWLSYGDNNTLLLLTSEVIPTPHYCTTADIHPARTEKLLPGETLIRTISIWTPLAECSLSQPPEYDRKETQPIEKIKLIARYVKDTNGTGYERMFTNISKEFQVVDAEINISNLGLTLLTRDDFKRFDETGKLVDNIDAAFRLPPGSYQKINCELMNKLPDKTYGQFEGVLRADIKRTWSGCCIERDEHWFYPEILLFEINGVLSPLLQKFIAKKKSKYEYCDADTLLINTETLKEHGFKLDAPIKITGKFNEAFDTGGYAPIQIYGITVEAWEQEGITHIMPVKYLE